MEIAGRPVRSGGAWGERLAGWVSRPWPWVLVLLLGLIARFRQYLANTSYWYDEAFLTVSIFKCSFWKLIGPLPGRTINPPLSLWLLRGCYLALGPQEWSLRLPAFVAGLAGLGLMIPLARRCLGRPAWLWAVGFCALSCHCVYRAIEVRTYTTDFVLTAAVLLTAHAYLNAITPRRRLGWGGGLLLAGTLAPWLSFSSAFVLAAASGALFLDYRRQKSPTRLAYWLGLNALLAANFFLVWFIQARHLYYPGLKEEWTFVWGGFPRNYALSTLLRFTLRNFVGLPHYATTGLGIPLLLLGAAGTARVWRWSGPEAFLLAGPVAITYLASLLGKYPFADRAVFFLAPCVWLLAAEGLLLLGERLPARATWAIPLLVLGLMAPGLVKTVQLCYRVEPMMEYRAALVYLHDHRSPGDVVWSWCQELTDTYAVNVFRWQPGAGEYPHDEAEASRIAQTRPLWVIAPDCAVKEMTGPLRALPVRQAHAWHYHTMTVLRFEPVRDESPRPAQPQAAIHIRPTRETQFR